MERTSKYDSSMTGGFHNLDCHNKIGKDFVHDIGGQRSKHNKNLVACVLRTIRQSHDGVVVGSSL